MPVFLDGKVELRPGDCRDVIRQMPDNSIDSVVCDPPYALVSIQKRFGKPGSAPANDGDVYARASAGFMGKQWDTGETAFAAEFWAEVLRVLKPGGHVVAFSGTRTYHRMAVAIEDAGFEIRDQLAWMYGSGFPKSHDVSKAIAKRRVEDVEPVRVVCRFIRSAMDDASLKSKDLTHHFGDCNPRLVDHWAARDTDSQPALPTNEQWDGLVDALSLAERDDFEHVAKEVARLNGRKGTHGARWAEAEVVGEVASSPAGFGDLRFEGDRTIRSLDEEAAQWQGWGTALKPAWEPICLARKPLMGTVSENVQEHGTGAINVDGCRAGGEVRENGPGSTSSLQRKSRVEAGYRKDAGIGPGSLARTVTGRWPANIVHDGSDEVLACFPETKSGMMKAGTVRAAQDVPGSVVYGVYGGNAASVDTFGDSGSSARFFYTAKADKMDRIGSKHPTVKPVDLMQWLCRMVTPPGGLVLDPFAGSGSTGEAAWREGFRCILIEREEEYQADIAERLRLASAGPMERKARAIKQSTSLGPLFGDNDNDAGGGGRSIYGKFADQQPGYRRRDNGR